MKPEEPWEIAAEHTLELYKKTKPSFSELTRATEKIQVSIIISINIQKSHFLLILN